MSTTRRRRLSEAQWRDLLGRFEPQGETVATFCAREGVCAASFYRWRAHLEGQPAGTSRAGRKSGTSAPLTHQAAGFVSLGSLPPTAAAEPERVPAGVLLRLDLGGGVVLQISRP
jgi:transposase-like protein